MGRRVNRQKIRRSLKRRERSSSRSQSLPRIFERLEDRLVLSVQFSPGSYLTPATIANTARGAIGSGFTPIEPFISVNTRTDPGVLAISQQTGLELSSNAGGIIVAGTPIVYQAPNNNSGGDTVTTFDSQGRLFWANLADDLVKGQIRVFVQQVNPTTGAFIGNANVVSGTLPAGFKFDDKEFIAAGTNTNNLYVAWTRFTTGGTTVELSMSTDQGVTWTAPLAVSAAAEGFVWPATVTVGPTGTVYVTYHATPGASDSNGEVFTAAYTADLSTQLFKDTPFPMGTARLRGVNSADYPNSPFIAVGGSGGEIGNGQTYLLVDPVRANTLYAIAVNDPNNGGAGDAADLILSKSVDGGATWTRSTLEAGPNNSNQLFPNASIDRFGDIFVSWYDNRNGGKSNGLDEYDTFAKYSTDGGLSFSAPFQVNAAANTLGGSSPSTRLGDYFSSGLFGGTAYVAFVGGTTVGATNNQQVFTAAVAINGSLTVTGDDTGGPTNDNFTLRQIAGNPGFDEVLDTVNGVTTREYAGLLTGIAGGIKFNGLSGNDTLTVDFSNGNPIPAGGLDDNGGDGFDSLILQGGAETADTYTPGLDNSSGLIQITAGATAGTATASTIHFENLSPVVDVVAGPTYVINGTPADNYINYTQGANSGSAAAPFLGATTGQVTVDNQESTEFANKATVTINGLAGNDTFNLDDPSTPTGLTSLTVNGDTNGTPTETHANNTLYVNGDPGVISFNPTGPGSGSITGALRNGGGGTFTQIENVVVDGHDAATPYDLQVFPATAGNNSITLDSGVNPMFGNSGTAADSGTINISGANGLQNAPTLSFLNLGLGVGSDVRFINSNPVATKTDTLTYNGTEGPDYYRIDALNGGEVLTTALPTPTAAVQFRVEGESVRDLYLNGGEGNDNLIIDDSKGLGLVDTANGAFHSITWDGGAGVNALQLVDFGNADGPAPIYISDTYSVGPNNGQGSDVISNAALVTPDPDPTNDLKQTVNFLNLSPVKDAVANTLLTVNGTPSDNAINYTTGPNSLNAADPIFAGAATGFVTVDNQESLEFTHKDNLIIKGQAGSDTINLNDPTVPTGSTVGSLLLAIGVNGGDPTGLPAGTDTVIVNAEIPSPAVGPPNTIFVAYGIGAPLIPTPVPVFVSTAPTTDEATVTNAQPVPIEIDQAESLVIDGQSLGNSLLVEPGPAAASAAAPAYPALNVITLTPGSDRDSGTILANRVDGASELPISYLHLGGSPVPPVQVASEPPATPPVETVNRIILFANTVVYNGTTANDTFEVGSDDTVTLVSTPNNATVTYVTVQVNAPNLRLNGLAGDDTFDIFGLATPPINGGGTAQAGSPDFTTILINGNDSGNNVVNLIGTAGVDNFAENFFSPKVPTGLPLLQGFPVGEEVTGVNGTIGLTGIQSVNLDGNGPTGGGPGDTLTVNGTQQDDLFTYTPLNTDDSGIGNVINPMDNGDEGMYTLTGFNTTFTFDEIAFGGFTIDGGPAPGTPGTPNGGTANQVVINGTAGRDLFRIDESLRIANVTDATGSELEPVILGPNIQVLTAKGLTGQDTFLVTPAPGTQYATVPPFPFPPGQPTMLDNLVVNIDGGAGSSGENNALVILNNAFAVFSPSDPTAILPATEFVVVNKGADGTSGTVRTYGPPLVGTPANGGPTNTQYPDINYVNIQTVSPRVGTDANGTAATNPFFGQPNLLVMGPDLNEPNETLANATFLGSGSTLQVQHATIFPNANEFPFVPADQDFYQVVAQYTGTLDFQTYFKLFDEALFPGGGTLDVQAFDAAGNKIADAASGGIDSGEPAPVATGPKVFGAVGSPGTNPPGFNRAPENSNARVRIPVVAGQSYYFRVVGYDPNGDPLEAGAVVNGYNVTVINTPAPVPATLELSRSVLSATVTNMGSGYIVAPQVTVTGGGPNVTMTAVATAFLGTGANADKVVLVTIQGGAGYTTAPTLSIDPPLPGPGVTATATATLGDTGDLPVGPLNTAELDDTGRSQFDNVTKVNNPVIFVRLDDSLLLHDLPGNQTSNVPPAGVIPINYNSSTSLVPTGAGNFRIALYDGGDGNNSGVPSTDHHLDPNDPTFIGFAEPVPDPQVPGTFVPHLYSLKIGVQPGNPLAAGDILADGLHNITARVQMIDPATPTETGFGDRSVALQITVDTVPPPVQFGSETSLGLVTDTGVRTEPETSTDLVTSSTRPTFQGLAEANSVVRVYAAITNPANPYFSATPVFPTNFIFIGETVAIPEDGTNAFPNGQWTLQSTVDLTDPRFFASDPTTHTTGGLRTLVVTAEDLAGNVSPVGPLANNPQVLQIFVDTQGPQVTDVVISDPTVPPAGTDGENLNYNLFSEKNANNTQGPTPLTYGITINIQDLPPRELAALTGLPPSFANELAFKPELVTGFTANPVTGPGPDGGITLVGDSNGRIAFRVVVNPLDTTPPDPLPPNTTSINGVPAATGEIQLQFIDANGNPIALPDDRYTLTIKDTTVVDPAGNLLDGESNAQEPLNNPTFPSGNGVPGGDFVARFTVDSRPEIGSYVGQQIHEDTNGNFVYDPQNPDFTNRDLSLTLQVDPSLVGKVSPLGVHDAVFTGNFFNPTLIPGGEGPGTPVGANGFDELAAFGYDPLLYGGSGGFRWLIDLNGDGVITPNEVFLMPKGFSNPGIPLAGDFSKRAANSRDLRRRRIGPVQRRDLHVLCDPGLRRRRRSRNWPWCRPACAAIRSWGTSTGPTSTTIRPRVPFGTSPPGRTTNSTSTTVRAPSSSSTTRGTSAFPCRRSLSASPASGRSPSPPTWIRTA